MGAIRIVLSIALISVIARSTAAADPVCGDGVTQAPEQCDDGGICIGGSKAGSHCTSESQCGLSEDGVCVGGVKDGTVCSTDDDCGSMASKCVRCKTFGGDGCAANCTFEHDVTTTLVTGQLNPDGSIASGSAFFVDNVSLQFGVTLGASCVGGDQHGLPCPNGDGDCVRLTAGGRDGVCTHSTTTATLGKELNGKIPEIIKATDIKFSPIAVVPLACACMRGVVFKTCGGTINEKDGTASTNCGDTRYGGGGVDACKDRKPCTAVFGPGNAAAGTVGCSGAGLDNVDFTITQDHAKATTKCTMDSQCTPDACVADPNGVNNCNSSLCCGASVPVFSFSGHGPAGSAIVLVATALGAVAGDCIFRVDKTAYGPDGLFCTDDDGEGQPTRGVASIAPLVTGKATGSFTNADGLPPPDGNLGPDTLTGHPFSCTDLANGIATGGAFAGAFTQVNSVLPLGIPLGDSVVTNVQVAAVRAATVGTGSAASCTDAALNTALTGGGLVTFNCGSAPVTIDISTGTGTKTIATDTTVDGGGLMTISGGHSVGVFSVNTGVTFTVQNLTIANGNRASGGSSGGGGILNNRGTLTVTDSTFSGNSASGPTLGGGAIFNQGGTLTVTNSIFSGNSAGNFGGGGILNGGTVTVTNSTFSGNSASNGGGIANFSTLTVTNSTFSDNSAIGGGSGGGISNFDTLTVTNSTFSDNSAIGGGSGGGISGGGSVTNSIVANSTSGGNCDVGVTDGGHNIDDDGSCGFSGTSLSNTNPMLDTAGLANNGGPTQTIALQAGSPAINAGDESVCAAPPVNNLDQRGFVRPGSGHTQCSIGAYEYNSVIGPTPTSTPTLAPSATATLAPTPSATPSPTLTRTPTLTATATSTATLTSSPTPSATPSRTLTRTPTRTLVPTPTVTQTPTATLKPSGGGGGCTLTPTGSGSAGWWLLACALVLARPRRTTHGS